MTEGLLDFYPVLDNPQLVPSAVYNAVKERTWSCDRKKFMVAEIDPQYAGGKELCDKYQIDVSKGANCLVVNGIRGKNKTYAACLVPVGYRYDMSGVVRKKMNARQVSVAPLNYVLEETQMEYGSITPIGLPKEWELFIDPAVLKNEYIVVGGGYVKSKLYIPSVALLDISNAVVLEGLAKET
jgi:prolyl-tRNA editing enzyme YbaK/EbsC (Cys-tRNA(Pro) deacylase)